MRKALGLLCALAGSPQASAGVFADITELTGLDFVHFNGMSGEWYLPEIMGSGGALFDYDGDGDLDLYLVQGAVLGPGKTMEDMFFPSSAPMTDRLYRNDLSEESETGTTVRFVDVTEASGLHAPVYGMGVIAGDIDNDGDVDLYVTNFGPNQLWLNNGDGTFSDGTLAAGVNDPRWSVGASFFDYDRDGWLDLYVGNYLDFSFDNHQICGNERPDYCSPLKWNVTGDRLFRNRGNGVFDDVTAETGIGNFFGSALGVAAADYDGDRWQDVYVANDSVLNLLWMNDGRGRFRNMALLSGAAVNADGHPEASMGIDAADYDADGDLDLFLAHLSRETSTLYANDGAARFSDATNAAGLGQPTYPFTGFGAGWLDYDNDGWLDLFTANGAVLVIEEQRQAGSRHPLAQRDQLFHNDGTGVYSELIPSAADPLATAAVSRGVMFGDLDNDGATDLVISNNAAATRVLRNEQGETRHWLGVRALTRGRDAHGALVRVEYDGEIRLQRIQTDGSYASSRDPRARFGLGPRAEAVSVRIDWPDGTAERWSGLEPDRYHALEQGQGNAVP